MRIPSTAQSASSQPGRSPTPPLATLAGCAARLRPACLAGHVVAAPLVALAAGAAIPWLADAARPALGPAVLVVVFTCVAAGEIAPVTRREA